MVHAVYNPLPGSWFAVAYLENYEEPHGLYRKCRLALSLNIHAIPVTVTLVTLI